MTLSRTALYFSLRLRVKKHGRLAEGIFRSSLDRLGSVFTELDLKYNEFLASIQFLSA